MTMFYSVIDLKKKQMVYSSAAHEPVLVWRPSKFTFVQHGQELTRAVIGVKIAGGSRRLGYLPGSSYKIDVFDLQKDDVIVWYTDGLIENTNANDEPFKSRNLKNVMKQCEGLSAEAIKDRIVEAAYHHYGDYPREDDVTLIVGKIK